MATDKPRLSVTLTPESRAALERLSEASGVAASQFISTLVHDSIPLIDATAKAFQIARTQPQKAAELLGAELVRAQILAAQGKLELDQAVSRRKLRKRPSRD